MVPTLEEMRKEVRIALSMVPQIDDEDNFLRVKQPPRKPSQQTHQGDLVVEDTIELLRIPEADENNSVPMRALKPVSLNEVRKSRLKQMGSRLQIR